MPVKYANFVVVVASATDKWSTDVNFKIILEILKLVHRLS